MEKLSIREASQKFGISRARLYQLLNKGIIIGHLSTKCGRSAKSWVNIDSLQAHISERKEKQRKGGRPKIKSDGKSSGYIPVWDAAQRTGYTTSHIYRLIRQGCVDSENKDGYTLVLYPNLLNYKLN